MLSSPSQRPVFTDHNEDDVPDEVADLAADAAAEDDDGVDGGGGVLQGRGAVGALHVLVDGPLVRVQEGARADGAQLGGVVLHLDLLH